jgi:hypothetical protein
MPFSPDLEPAMSEGPDPSFELLPNPEPIVVHRRHGRLIASVAAVVALAGGGTAAYVAVAGKDIAGSATPQAAVQKLVGDLQRSDFLGFVNDLAPGERTALSAPLRDSTNALQRLGVLAGNANLARLPGFSFRAHDLAFADRTVKINDHVQIVQITGGSIDVGADVAKLPLTKRILKLVGDGANRNSSEHHDLASGRPVRIAAEQVGGRWYGSIFYTAADDASDHARPDASDAIAARGAASPEQAVRSMVRDLLGGNLRSALALVSPDELGAVHDYGGLILRAAPHWSDVHARIKTLDLTTTGISGGAVRVGLHKLVVQNGGQQFSLTLENGCATVATAGFHQKVCAADAAELITDFIGAATCGIASGQGVFRSESDSGYGSIIRGSGSSAHASTPPDFSSCGGSPVHFTKAQKQAITDVFTTITKLGVDTAQVGGSWYVAPVRTLADVGVTLLSGMKGDDLFQLATLGH